MNKKRFVLGLVLLAAGFAGALPTLIASGETVHPAWLVPALIAGVLIVAGLALSAGELARSVVKRLKESREREKVNRDRQRQAPRSRGRSTSQ